MAEINVQKKGASVWPWVLGLLVAVLLIWALMGLFAGDEEEVQTVEPASEMAPEPAATTPVDTFNVPAEAPL